MAIAPPAGYNPWYGTTTSVLTLQARLYYRVFGGRSARIGDWLTPMKPSSQSVARAGLALPPANLATSYCEVWVPAGMRIQIGVAGSNFGHPGGWEQAQLLHRIPVLCFGPPLTLPPP
jgi:hypothetical protein